MSESVENNPIEKDKKPEIDIHQQEYQEKYAKEQCILNVVSGSHAIGTNIPSSDWDERGVYVTSKEEIIFPDRYFEQVVFREDDTVLYEAKKYLTLLHEQNPNFIEMLWVEPSDVLHCTEAGKILLENREYFLTKNVFNTYANYAHSQMKRINGHNKWISNPQPESPPQQKDFISVMYNLTENKAWAKKVPNEMFYAIPLGNNQFALFNKETHPFNGSTWISRDGCISPLNEQKRQEFLEKYRVPDVMVKYNHEEYKVAHNKWKNYWTWKENRNEVRSGLEAKHGYDTKHAMHIIRLLNSGQEILETGQVRVRRPDAEFLLSIRNGRFTYEELLEMTNKKLVSIEEAYLNSKLPQEIDKKYTQKVLTEIYETHWASQLNHKKKVRP